MLRVALPGHPGIWKKPERRQPLLAGLGRHRKIALLGGASTIKPAPWWDPTWELWAHASCRALCKREPDVFFDLHPPELWKDPKKKFWDPSYYEWLKQNHVPIYMQTTHKDIPSALKYPFETMITEFPRGYMTNTLAYMVALALMEGVTHLGIFGCNYGADSEYGPQRGSAEYWLGVAEGRGVQVLIPPGCDLLNKPSLLYGYESHPHGKRDPSYSFVMPKSVADLERKAAKDAEAPPPLVPIDAPNVPPLRDIGVPPALDKAGPWIQETHEPLGV